MADTLPLSLIAEGIGAGWPLLVAPSVNSALANHPQYKQNLNTLTNWGATVVPPQPQNDLLLMASTQTIVQAIGNILAEIGS